jgi:hypothetical protein
MTPDDRLKALYRASIPRDSADVSDADIEQALSRSGWPDEDDTALDRIAGSALHADVLRMVMELGPDAEALSRDLAALRKPRMAPPRRPGVGRSWAALAAGVGTAAVLIAGLGTLDKPGPSGPPSGPQDVILSASFDGPGEHDPAPQAPQPIFNGGFDS